jgi:beta-lactamase class A
MKRVVVLRYNAQRGIQYERRLPKSTQFVVGAYLLVIGLVAVMAIHGFKLTSHGLVAKHSTETRLVSHTATATSQEPKVPVPSTPRQALTTDNERLNGAVQAAIDQNQATTWSVAVYDINAKSWLVRNNAMQQMSSASLYKLYAAYGLAEKISPAQWPTVQVVDGHSLQDCVDLMIRVSDNTCGDAIGTYVGWHNIDLAIHAAGFTGTTLNLASGPVTTAADTTRFMASLYQGKLFDPTTTAFLLNSLQNQLYRTAIPAGCPGCTVYNKTGNEGTVAHDSAVVVSGAHTYAVTIMSDGGGSYAKIATVERAIQTALITPGAPVSP